jgi:formamidopyrimidine-DNA glycosylase
VPELPEVETVVRSLAPNLTGRTIIQAHFSSAFVVKQDFAQLSQALAGQTVRALRRHGKFILAELDRGVLSIHLGMTGKLLFGGAPGPHTRAWFELDEDLLVYDDIRHFGRIEWNEQLPQRISKLGPDALTLPLDQFLGLLKRHKTRIKPLLLNQTILRGMGNIYTDEALFAAGVHPKTMAGRLSRPRASLLHSAMMDVLTRAIAAKGSSISDYVDAQGQRGSFQLFHQVYGRAGEPCLVCGTPIRRIVVAQRGTHFCPKCQKQL